MQFTAMSIWLFTGLAVLTAGVLAALQFLRIRPRRVRVVTTLFWRQAADQAQARTLFERFRHPRTYLLLLAACLFVLLALATPVFHSEGDTHRVIALEAGLAMRAADERFENARDLVRAEAHSLGEERVAVITADPQPRVLKHFDEGLPALERRLAELKPADAPVLRDDVLDIAKSLLAGRGEGEVVLVTAQPATVDDDQVRVLAAGGEADNAFILSAVFTPDSTDPTRGTFHCRVGSTGKQGATVTVAITRADDTLFGQTIEIEPGGMRELAVADLAADGSVLHVSLDGGGAIAGDDRIAFPLPDRRQIRLVSLPGFELPEVLVLVLESLPEVSSSNRAGADEPVIRIGPVGSDAEIQIHAAESTGDWLPVRASGHVLVAGMEFEDALCRAPAAEIGQVPGDTALLMAGASPLAILDPASNRLTVAASLLDEQASVVRRSAYLVFWATMLHHLAGWHDEPLTLSPAQGARWTDVGAEPVVMKAGFGNFNLTADGVAATPGGSGATRPPVWHWLLVGALALMLVEAVLHLRGKIS